jgi:CoA:oxalate CoA-transferase
MTKPLAGLRVVDFTTMVAGPTATRYLADCGAEVIKVESADGDLMRGDDAERRLLFGQFNVGKKSVVADLKSPEGASQIRSLVASADVLVENFQPGVMARLGLAYDALAKEHPKLIYCAISGFGQDGPMAKRPAYAPVVHAYSGLDLALGQFERSDGEPLRHNLMFADVVAGIVAFGAIQTALLHRERHGLGSFVDVSLLDATMQLLSLHVQRAQAGVPPSSQAVYPPIKALDGYMVVPMISPRFMQKAYFLVGLDPAAADFSCIEGIREARARLAPALEAWVGARNCGVCDDELTAANIPCAAYRDQGASLHDPQSQFRGAFSEVADEAGHYRVLNTPFRIVGADVSAGSTSPALGADTSAVLGQSAAPPKAE